MRTMIIGILGLIAVALSSQSAEPLSADQAAREYFTDLALVTQDGEEMRFYSDVLKDQVVLISFIYTNCQGACPLITQKMRAARDLVGEDLGTDLRLISISIDPERDTPEAMKAFAAAHQADGNWLFLTGAPENVNEVVRKLGQYKPDVESHSTLLIAGNVNHQHWIKIPPMAGPVGVAENLRSLLDPI